MKGSKISLQNEKGFIVNERIHFIQEVGKICAKLLAPPKRILSVKNLITGQMLYENVDFEINGERLTAKSAQVRFLNSEWLVCKGAPEGIRNEGEEYGVTDVFLFPPIFLAEQGYEVTYLPQEDISLPDCVFCSEYLQEVLERAREKKRLSVTLLGDSISNAANSSGEGNFPPYAKPWYESGFQKVEEYYGDMEISFQNRSRSGYGTEWAVTIADSIWEESQDDLLIIAFGMNDATASLSTKEYLENIQKILEKRKNKEGAFVLVSSILPNPESSLYYPSLRKEYEEGLYDFCKKKGGAFIDMTAVSRFLIEKKRYCEISGNNFNHPNDFVYELYRKALVSLLTKME